LPPRTRTQLLHGLPPAWYKSSNYRSRVVREPRQVLQKSGIRIPDDSRSVCTTPPPTCATWCCRPAGGAHLDEEQLVQLATRDSLIGAAMVSAPA